MKKRNSIWLSCISCTLALGLIAAEPEDTKTVQPDNTEINVRDRDGKTLTPENQSYSKEDVLITKKIRRALMKDKDLSIAAKNVKIITVDGKVTLRGPVTSKSEKKGICAKAKEIAGKDSVDDQLEIKIKD